MARSGTPDQNPTLRGRRLALELLHRREATGLSREEVARRLEWSTSTLFRIETGRSRPQPGNVRALLELYGVTGDERDGLIQLAREARQPGWWQSFRDVLPNPYEVYIGLEAGAASIRNFEPLLVPGLLQTEAYARELSRNGPLELDRDEVERRVEVRMARQRILARSDRPRLWAIIDEAVIHRQVGGPAVMREQLQHLIATADQGKTTIQVVPYRAGAYAGTAGPFVIMEFQEPTDPAVVYIETLAGDIYIEEAPDVNRYTLAFERLLAAALHPDESVRLIEQTASAMT
ncbi:MAG TPA: helix-turn-helix transcriptional regulator [Streptosporangiaceae bacterium]|jgi:transcriptional regulator with XRE-family HTH domain